MSSIRHGVAFAAVATLALLSLATAFFGLSSRGKAMELMHTTLRTDPGKESETLTGLYMDNGCAFFAWFTMTLQDSPDEYEVAKENCGWRADITKDETNFRITWDTAAGTVPNGGYYRRFAIGKRVGWAYCYCPHFEGPTKRDCLRRVDAGAPWWCLAICTATLPAWYSASYLVRVVVARRRRNAGQCKLCGYDLRGTPERCPECGKIKG